MRNELWVTGNLASMAIMVWICTEYHPSIGLAVGFALAVLVDIRAGIK